MDFRRFRTTKTLIHNNVSYYIMQGVTNVLQTKADPSKKIKKGCTGPYILFLISLLSEL